MKKRFILFGMIGIVLCFVLVMGGCVAETPDAPYINVEWDSDTYQGIYLALDMYGVNIYWKHVPGAKEYIVYYGKGMDTSLFTRYLTTNMNSCGHGYKKEEGKYYYAVKASNSVGTSGFSNVATW